MRKSLWIIPVLSATIVVPNANADSITAATTVTDLGSTTGTMDPPLDDPTLKYVCCNGAPAMPEVTDLTVKFKAIVTVDPFFPRNIADCTAKGIGLGSVWVLTCTTIKPDDIIDVASPAAGVSGACWTTSPKNSGCTTGSTPAIPVGTPEPATGGLTLLGLGMLMRRHIAQWRRRAT
jgi:hypothetical protein